MVNLWEKSKAELEELYFALVCRESFNAAAEVKDFIDYYGNAVTVTKGKHKGVTGTVTWLKRVNYSKYPDYWGLSSKTRAGIKTEAGDMVFTNVNNLEKVER